MWSNINPTVKDTKIVRCALLCIVLLPYISNSSRSISATLDGIVDWMAFIALIDLDELYTKVYWNTHGKLVLVLGTV